MKNKPTETKLKPAFCVAGQVFSRALFWGVSILICSSAPAQNLFVSDGYSNSGSIYKFTPDGVQSTFASGLNASGAGGPGALVFDRAGNLFVTVFSFDSNGVVRSRIYKFTPDGVQSTFASGLDGLGGLAFDSAGNLFMTDSVPGLGGSINGTIYKFTPDGMRTIFALGLSFPSALAFDRAGNLFVVDGYGILKFTPDGVRTTFASGFNTTTGLACDSTGNLFVSVYGRGVMPSTGIGTGAIHKFTPAGVQSTFAYGLNGPTALAFDSAGNLFVSDDAVTDSTEEKVFPGAIYKFSPDGKRSAFAANLHGFSSMAVQPTQSTPTPTPSPVPTPTPTATTTPTPTPGPTGAAVMLSPAPGSTFSSSSVTFQWTAGSATAYALFVGTSQGSGNIYYSGVVQTLSATVNKIPTNGSTIYVKLYSQVNGFWKSNNYTYTAFNASGSPTSTPTPTPTPTATPTGTATPTPSGTVSKPVIAPGNGTYSGSITVHIYCGTSGATIHYTLDSSTPTAASPTYPFGGFVLSTKGAQTVKAIGTKSSMSDSPVASASYTIN